MIDWLMANMHTDEVADDIQDQLEKIERRLNILAEKLGVVFDDEEE